MARRPSGDGWVPGMPVGRRTLPGGSYDPFYEFKMLARADKQPGPARPGRAQQALVTLLTARSALVVMTCVAVAAAFILIVLVVAALA